MDYVLMMSWAGPIPERETKAMEVLADLRTYFGKLAAAGQVSEPVLFLHVDSGYVYVRGTFETIFEIMGRDDFIELADKAMLVAEDFTFKVLTTGEEAERRLKLYLIAAKELAYIP